jgi:O-antigen/teichoic acid export membrane protein
VAFPALARLLVSNPIAARRAEKQWLAFAAGALGTVALLLSVMLEPMLTLWLRQPADPASVSVGQWLCFGMWLNGIGQMLMASIHARGNFRDTALLHIVELLIYLAALTVVIPAYGTIGASVLWSVRALFDTGGLVWIWSRHVSRKAFTPPAPTQ